MRSLLAGICCLAPLTAAAQTYDVLGWSPERLVAVERESVADAGGLRRAKITVIYASPRAEGSALYQGVVGVQEFDCAQGRYHTLQSEPFDRTGAPISGAAVREPTAWSAVTQGTLGEDEMMRVCRGAWSSQLYPASLTALMDVYRLRPDPPPSHAAAARAAAEYGSDVAGRPGD